MTQVETVAPTALPLNAQPWPALPAYVGSQGQQYLPTPMGLWRDGRRPPSVGLENKPTLGFVSQRLRHRQAKAFIQSESSFKLGIRASFSVVGLNPGTDPLIAELNLPRQSTNQKSPYP